MILILDIFVLIVLGVFILIGIKKGLLSMVFNFLSFIISILISKFLYPVISKILMKSENVYEPIKMRVIEFLDIEKVVVDNTIKSQNNFINQLPLPENILKSLSENNNPEVYKILNVAHLEDYIGSFVTNVIINAMAMILVFIIAFIIMKLISYTLGIVTEIPIVRSFDSIGGGVLGFAQGILIIWVLMIISTLFLSGGQSQEISQSINNSFLALKLYENNILLSMITKVFS